MSTHHLHAPARRQRGVTLIELMVTIVVGLMLTLAVYMVMTSFEGRRRTSNSGSELDKAGALAMTQLDRRIRSAGSGFMQASAYAYGCALHASKDNKVALPAGALAAPFDKVDPGDGGFRLAPVLILPGQTTPGDSGSTSDVLVVMSAAPVWGAIPVSFSKSVEDGKMSFGNSLPFQPSDMLLIADRQPSSEGGTSPCLVTQIASDAETGGTNGDVSVGGTWYADEVDEVVLADYSDTATAMVLGNPGLGRSPDFSVMGVGDHSTFFAYDLLQVTDTPLTAAAEGVFELHALYGVDTSGDSVVDAWLSPSVADSGYELKDLTDGSEAAAGKLRAIKAIRVGLILRTALPERDEVTGSDLALFSDLGDDLTFTRELTADERHFRYRVLESTIPLRNNLSDEIK